jgi:hypothetical protein
MLGKIAGAWIGSRMAGRGAKGALIGAVAALAKRRGWALARLRGGGYGVQEIGTGARPPLAAYPSEATPAPPSG